MGFSRQRAARPAPCLAQGIEAKSPDDDRREEEDLQRKARPPRRAGVAPKCVYCKLLNFILLDQTGYGWKSFFPLR
ncbi:MAG: hypothetical protein LBH90_01305, partial [Tannerella sp.]|nr:hypothetical protein [Tannerella sp.]